MSIRARLTDAKLLWQSGRREGALLSVLVALAATSRKRYPRDQVKHDNEAFTRFVSDEMPRLTSMVGWMPCLIWTVRYNGKAMPFERFLYKFLRCELAHVAKIPPNIEFLAPPIPVAIMPRGNKLLVHPNVIVGLSEIVLNAPENDDEFPEPSAGYTDFSI